MVNKLNKYNKKTTMGEIVAYYHLLKMIGTGYKYNKKNPYKSKGSR